MIQALVFLAPGFEEIEAVTIIDVLRRAQVNVSVAGLSANNIQGAHGINVVPDKSLDVVSVLDYDAIICPGGAPGYKNLRNDKRVIQIIKTAYDANKLVAGICAAPAVLADAGILNEKNCTIYPGMENELLQGGGNPCQDDVVVDGKVITSKGPATAMIFAIKLVELLKGKQVADSVSKQMLLK